MTGPAETPVGCNAGRREGEGGGRDRNSEVHRNPGQGSELHLAWDALRVPYSPAGMVRQGAPLRIVTEILARDRSCTSCETLCVYRTRLPEWCGRERHSVSLLLDRVHAIYTRCLGLRVIRVGQVTLTRTRPV